MCCSCHAMLACRGLVYPSKDTIGPIGPMGRARCDDVIVIKSKSTGTICVSKQLTCAQLHSKTKVTTQVSASKPNRHPYPYDSQPHSTLAAFQQGSIFVLANVLDVAPRGPAWRPNQRQRQRPLVRQSPKIVSPLQRTCPTLSFLTSTVAKSRATQAFRGLLPPSKMYMRLG